MATHDYTIANARGRAVRTDFNNALAALVTNNSSATPPSAPYPGMLWLDLSVLPDGQMKQRNQSNTGWITMSGLPEAAALSDMTAGTDDLKFVSADVMDQSLDRSAMIFARNRIVNPAMQVSQENGDSAIANGNHAADQWQCGLSGASVVAFLQRVTVRTPRGSAKRLRYSVNTPKAILAASDIAGIYQFIEGNRIADFRFGTAQAKQIILRFGFKGPAGTYTAVVRNMPNTRSYVAPFTISAAQDGIDTEQVFVIPGDTTGTWVTDFNAGMIVAVFMACGTTYQTTTVNAWIAGNFVYTPTASNGLGAVADFDFFDVGLYEDVSGIGTPPRWVLPEISEVQHECLRYYAKTSTMFSGQIISGNVYYSPSWSMPFDMRIASSSFTGGTLTQTGFPATPAYVIIAAPTPPTPPQSVPNRLIREHRTANAGGTGHFQTDGVAVSARM